MPRSGATADERPWFGLCVTGHASAIEAGSWMYRGDPTWAREVPGVVDVWRKIDAALGRRLGSHRVAVYSRSTIHGIDHAVRAYAAVRGVHYQPLDEEKAIWRERSAFRRDLELVSRCHAVLWFGPEETDGDPARLAMILGIPVQIVPNQDSHSADLTGHLRGE